MLPAQSYWFGREGEAWEGRWRATDREGGENTGRSGFIQASTEMHQAGGSRLSNVTERSGKMRRKKKIKWPQVMKSLGKSSGTLAVSDPKNKPFHVSLLSLKQVPSGNRELWGVLYLTTALGHTCRHKRKWQLTTSWYSPPPAWSPDLPFKQPKSSPGMF